MSNFYPYLKRPIASCDGLKRVTSIDTTQSVYNSIALYQRPKLIHSGPFVHWTTQQPIASPWPWITLDDDAEKNTLIDQCTFYPQHQNGVIDINLKLLCATAASTNTRESNEEVITSIPLTFTVNIYQYENGSDTKNTIFGSQTNLRVNAFPCLTYPYSPALTNIFWGWNFIFSGVYNKYVQTFGDGSGETTRRPAQLYAPDFKFLQSVNLRTTYNLEGVDSTKPLLITVDCNYTTGQQIFWANQIPTSDPFRDREWIRVFNVSSSMTDRGVIT